MKNIAFIGAGDISLLHAEAIKNCSGAQLKGLWNYTLDLAEEKATKFGCQIYDSLQQLLDDPEIDGVFVLTNLETHCDYACAAMNAGKHVLVEKPVGSTIAELEQMKACAAENGVVLMPGHNYIHEDGLQRTKELIENGKLGDLVSIYVMYNIHHPEEVAKRYPGVIRHILTHHSYILTFLAGDPEEVSAMKSVVHYDEFEGEDLAMVNLKMKSGAIAHFCASFAADDNAGDPWSFLVKVIGTEGATRFSYRDWVENKPGVVHHHTYSAYEFHIRNEVDFFVNRCLVNGEAPPSTIDDAIMAQRIIEACETSVRELRTVKL
ncbi:MAG: Gfo/Idh/MocA family oxidoreductase [Verrucomicrobiota bacterium]